MTKVVYNACYGGFGLSKEACQRYWDIKGQQVWIEDEKLGLFTVWFVPPEERPEQKEWSSMTMDERIAYNKAYSKHTWRENNVDRHDPVLVQVVEELGDKANGKHAKLVIGEVDGPYRIDEYDGNESVMTSGDYDWITP
tara:strand:- start:1363 stop:1779 length:417 start_codon:yes stop_codon:yes gene_type:complete